MYVGRAKDLYRDLVATGFEMKPDELAWSVLAGLPKSFGTLRTILEASESAISSVDAVLPKLLVHEQGFEVSPTEKGGGGSDSAVAYVAGRKGGKEKGHGKDESRGKGPKCYICGEFGHIARNCSKPDRREHKPERKKGGKPPKGVAFSVIEGVSTDDWLVDSGSSQHLIGNKSLFESLEMLRGSGREFIFGNKGTLWAEGSGSVELRCATPSGESLVTLQNVMYVPGVAVNLISLKSVRTDRGKKYVNKALEDVFRGKGTVHEKIAPCSAEQSGSAERLNRDLEEKTRAMLEDSGLAKELWAETVVTANYTRNRTPVSAHGRTPWEVFFGEKPNVGHIKVFGARASRHVPKQRRRKLDLVSERCVFVGYEPDSKAYRLLRDRDGK
ncbi:Transposon-encoded protein with ribonuclease H-like, integrase and retrovirus zinc finger-like domains [Klebsormidium nitens]|uniref:Transposon-encoded protein with ribonuclease H-like, integrase and retrovirus zinc finger-like domains n=1 Tax=Klebsormidium nitens TaxID=105231 RepID=A0A1Y1IR28_KLENI|nr:Transposon-encoded protein with ribonuclease H-like, integrase and retrovirus zinc finger-like domains [Klebsormidium nitens]|eukprot:GAQ93154.1 Transposon-encoded protein with ribonuclease H-like, integrase and retrovirus zinc finger-like domains [Klebsormidium nitens]